MQFPSTAPAPARPPNEIASFQNFWGLSLALAARGRAGGRRQLAISAAWRHFGKLRYARTASCGRFLLPAIALILSYTEMTSLTNSFSPFM